MWSLDMLMAKSIANENRSAMSVISKVTEGPSILWVMVHFPLLYDRIFGIASAIFDLMLFLTWFNIDKIKTVTVV